MAQRRAANIRERRRMFNLNEAFDKLRRKVRIIKMMQNWIYLNYITWLHPLYSSTKSNFPTISMALKLHKLNIWSYLKRRKITKILNYFDLIRRLQVPTFAYEKRLSRIETLRLAITYIGFMTEILSGTPPNEPNRPNELTAYPPSTSHPHHHHHHHLPIQREFIPPYNHQWIEQICNNNSISSEGMKAKWI